MDSLLSSIDSALHEMNHQTWEVNLKRINVLLLGYTDLFGPPGFDRTYNLRLSPVFGVVMDSLGNKVKVHAMSEPYRRFIFDGPLVFTNYYREGWMEEMMKYIVSKIKLNEVSVSPLDPFQEDRVILPFKESFKGENFFSLVKRFEDEKRAVRGY